MLNAEFLRFAAHWGFLPRSCRPYRARTKGKVERPIRYVRESFFYGLLVRERRRSERAGRALAGGVGGDEKPRLDGDFSDIGHRGAVAAWFAGGSWLGAAVGK